LGRGLRGVGLGDFRPSVGFGFRFGIRRGIGLRCGLRDFGRRWLRVGNGRFVGGGGRYTVSDGFDHWSGSRCRRGSFDVGRFDGGSHGFGTVLAGLPQLVAR
jgi:hypothetical protein